MGRSQRSTNAVLVSTVRGLPLLEPVEARPVSRREGKPARGKAGRGRRSPGRHSSGERRRCELCRRLKDEVVATDCCGRLVCKSLARYGCYRGHARFSLCGAHHIEQHDGDWKTCGACRTHFSEVEVYVWFGTNDRFNFEKLENPPAYEPSYCRECGCRIRLGSDGYQRNEDQTYTCERCWTWD